MIWQSLFSEMSAAVFRDSVARSIQSDGQTERARHTLILAAVAEAKADLASAPKRVRAALTPEQRERKREADRARRAKQKEAA